MVNVLIADDNIYYAKLLMDLINDEEVRVCNIAITGKEALNIIQKSNNIDVILLNLKTFYKFLNFSFLLCSWMCFSIYIF